jgi:hypothetical protein
MCGLTRNAFYAVWQSGRGRDRKAKRLCKTVHNLCQSWVEGQIAGSRGIAANFAQLRPLYDSACGLGLSSIAAI